jgi:hypothetical protein
MPNWLWRSIASVSATIAALAILQWGACTFWVVPKFWNIQTSSALNAKEKTSQPTQSGCEDASGRSVAALMALLTTLISLSRQAKDR